jgi:integral membrane protein (TIGR01906 family)
MKSSPLIKILTWIVTLYVPVFLTLLSVRLIMIPWFVEFEYRTPNFPADEYGFTREERLKYSKIAIDYLLNDAGISFLGDLRFPDGQQAPGFSCQFMDDCTRLYNDRELMHMLDVKLVVQGAMRVLYASAFVLFGLGIWAWFGQWWNGYLHGLSRGGWLTVISLGAIILFVLLAFGVIFVFFHQIFFSSGTWTFFYSDTLIRLFPERFWRDTFLIVGGLAAGMGALLGWIFTSLFPGWRQPQRLS